MAYNDKGRYGSMYKSQPRPQSQPAIEARSPYNFVPFSDKILEYEGEVPGHDSVDPALKTGEIHVTLTAQTPVFVSDGDKSAGGPHFFRGPDGRYALPGSSVRGMVRANMQILGFGLVRAGEDLEDRRMFFRKVAAIQQGSFGELQKYYETALSVKHGKAASGKTFSDPQKVQAGYLYRENGRYYIRPAEGKYLKVSKKTLDAAGLGGRHAEQIKVYYKDDGSGSVKEIHRSRPEGMKEGVLLCPGMSIGDKAHRYVFPPEDKTVAPIPIPKEDELSYAADWEGRRTTLRNADFWKLPKGGDSKAVFYVRQGDRIYFGMTLFLRIGYKHTLGEGLPPEHGKKRPDFLDYPHAILGYAGKRDSLRSRVSFGDFAAGDGAKEAPGIPMILGAPKPSYYPGYVVNGDHYNKDDFRLRGYKQYWLKTAQKPFVEDKRANVSTLLRPLPAGTAFSGVIRYKNLRAEELGLLLWAIRLETGCCQSMGMGKPYGYGQMRCVIDNLREYDLAGLYSFDNLCAGPVTRGADAVEAYIGQYRAYAKEKLGIDGDLRDDESVSALLYMRRPVKPENEKKFTYMALKEFVRAGKLATVAEIQKRGSQPK